MRNRLQTASEQVDELRKKSSQQRRRAITGEERLANISPVFTATSIPTKANRRKRKSNAPTLWRANWRT
jgi:hypothetical protein